MDQHNFIESLQQDLEWYPSGNYRRWKNHRVLSADEFNTLAYYSQNGCSSCLELTTIYSTRLIYSIVDRHRDDRSIEDHYMQSGFMGVLQAVEKWKQELGNFTTYAFSYIDRNVRSVINEDKDFIRVKNSDRHTLTSQIQYLFLAHKSECEFNQLPHNMESFTRWLNANGYTRNIKKGKLTPQEINEMLLITSIDSLDRELLTAKDQEAQMFVVDTIIDPSDSDPLIDIINEHCSKVLKLFYEELLHILTEKQRQIIMLYYNLNGDTNRDNLTFRQISKTLKETTGNNQYSVSTCKELHTDALTKIKQYVEENGYTYENFSTI